MALIVEDGTVVTGANTYASIATVTAYCASMGYAEWAATGVTDAQREAAILRAMAYIEALSWYGIKTARDNPLAWPRSGMCDREGYALDSNAVPAVVVKALCEAAYRELKTAGTLQPDETRDDSLTSLSVAGAVSLQWAAGAPSRTNFRMIRDLLAGLIQAGGGIRLVRG